MNTPTVFISYSHDSPEHADRVLHLANQLVRDGIDCILDQYETSPREGWPRWMDRHIRESDFVIMICTETYCRRVVGQEEPGKGCGVKWEGNLIYQHIYNAGTENARFIPVLFESGKVEYIPTPLQGATYYCADTEQGYEDLYLRLTDQPRTEKPEIGQLGKLPSLAPRERKQDFFAAKVSLAKLPSTSPDLFGREEELAMLDAAWDNPQTNVVSLVAWGGVGKTALVNKWLLKMGRDNYRGAEQIYGYSFYSQGAAEGRQVSADVFIGTALEWFGDPDPRKGSPWDKGERLAELVSRHRTLLILDGLEPLQCPPGEMEGRLKDPGLQSLLRELARHNSGLCIVTTRLPVDDLKEFVDTSVERINLGYLSSEAGVELLENLGVNGTADELREAVGEFYGHALALILLGRYLTVVYKGDIRQRDKIGKLTNEKKQGGHARRVMESYEGWFEGKPELNIVYIMGLFDRPAEGGAIEALRAEPAIENLTSELQGLSHDDWQYALRNLREARLLAEENVRELDALDCHPLIREHFGDRLKRSNPKAWKKAHCRLYEYYKSHAKEYPDTVEEMAPLYAATTHGCQADRHEEVLNEVIIPRIQRGEDFFNSYQLGAFGAELTTLSGFFVSPWARLVADLKEGVKAYISKEAGYCLRALGRLKEAIPLVKDSFDVFTSLESWDDAAESADILSRIYLAFGNLSEALTYAQESVDKADLSGDPYRRMSKRATLANVLHHADRLQEAEVILHEAEGIQRKREPQFPILHGMPGYFHCDLLLSQGEYLDVEYKASTNLDWHGQKERPVYIALHQLVLGRAHLLQAQEERTGDFSQAATHLSHAVDGLRQAGYQHHLSRGLLARAELYRVMKDFKRVQRDLDEVMTIATRGGMHLHQADCHLEYSKLYLAMDEKDKACESLDKAKEMIEQMGYHRRDRDVMDLEEQLIPI